MPGKRPTNFANLPQGTTQRNNDNASHLETMAASGSAMQPRTSRGSTSSSATDTTLIVIEKGTLATSGVEAESLDSEAQRQGGEEQGSNTTVAAHRQEFISHVTSLHGNSEAVPAPITGDKRIRINLGLTSLLSSLPQHTADTPNTKSPSTVHTTTEPLARKRERKQKHPQHISQIQKEFHNESLRAAAMANLTNSTSASAPEPSFTSILPTLLQDAKIIRKFFRVKRRKAVDLADDACWLWVSLREQYGVFVTDDAARCGYRRETAEEFLARTGREMGSLGEEGQEVDEEMVDGLEDPMEEVEERGRWREGEGWGGNEALWRRVEMGLERDERWVGWWREEYVRRKREEQERDGDVRMEG